MTDRELLESLIEKMDVNQSQINNIELKLDQFIKQYNGIVYGYARNDKYESK